MSATIINGNVVPVYPTVASLPISAPNGSLAVTLDTNELYEFNSDTHMWTSVGGGGGGSGTVTSVSITAPAIFTVSGSPVTSSGTIAITANSESANEFYASPNGSAGVPSFRAIVAADIPTLNQNTTGSAASFTGSLSGDVTGTQGVTVVALVDGSTAAAVHATVVEVAAATSADTPSTLIERDSSGNFSAGTITAALTGNATTATTSVSFTGSLLGDVTGTQSATVVSLVDGSTAAAVHTAEQLVNNPEPANVVLAGPASGSSASPTFRAIVSADIPTLNQNTTGTASNITATSNSTLTTLSALSLPTSQLSGQTTLAQLPTISSDTILGNNTGSSTTPIALTGSQVISILPTVVGASGSSAGTAGIVPAPAAYSGQSGEFLSANGTYVVVDQSKTIQPSFSLVATAAAPSGAIKFETTSIFTSITTGKPYAVGVGFIDTPTLTIWDISDETSPVLVGTYSHSAGGAYNCTFGVVAGVQYCFIGYNSGSKVDVVNMTNPSSPVDVGTFTITGSPGSIYGVSFLNGYVYCATQSTGLVVLDVGGGTGSPAAPIQTYQQAGGAKSFGVVAVGSNVYTTMYSTSSPYTVRQIVSWTLSGAGTPAIPSLLQSLQVTTAGEALGLTVSGNTAFVSTSATGAYNTNLIDITTPSAMTNLSFINSVNPFGSAFNAVENGFIGTQSESILYIPSGSNATYGGAIDAYDITNRSSPIHIAQVTVGIPNNVFGGIALYGGYIFAADYGNSTGTTGQLEVFTQLQAVSVFGEGVGSTLTLNSLTPNTALVSNSSDQVISSITTATELSYVHGVTSAIQTQLNAITAGGPFVPTSEVGAANGVASLDGSGKVPLAQLPAALFIYQGQWNPTTNTPTLIDGTGTTAYTYIVSAVYAGPIVGLSNPTMVNFQVGNLIIYNGTQWEQVDSATGVTSVNGSVGAVTVNAINQLTGDVTASAASGSQSKVTSLVATSNGTLVTLSALSLPGSQVTGNISGNAGNITATSNSSLTTLSSLSLPASQLTGLASAVSGDTVANITATSNSTLTTLSALSLPGSQVAGNISGTASNITATSNSTLTSLPDVVINATQISYTPTTPSDWGPTPPTTLQQALDQIAKQTGMMGPD